MYGYGDYVNGKVVWRHNQGAGKIASDPDARPLVSVIVPAHNAEETLRESLRSALAGTYPNIEVIVVDDGSSDGTADLASELARLDPRVRLHRHDDKGGVSAALNSGLSLASGEYVARLDSDDLWHPTKIEKQVALALSEPDLAFIYTFVRYIDGEDRIVPDVPAQCFPHWALCRGLYESLVGANSSAMMRRSDVEEVGGYDESLASWEDLHLQLKISARHPIGFVPEYLVGYRVRIGSLSSNPANMLSSWRVVRQRIDQEFPDIPRFVRNWSHGKRCAEFAEAYAWRRRSGPALALLIEALWHDPAWTFWFVQDRLYRRLSRPKRPVRGPTFFSCSPEQSVQLDLRPGNFAGRRLHRLDQSRRETLDAVDANRRPPAEAGQGSFPRRLARS